VGIRFRIVIRKKLPPFNFSLSEEYIEITQPKHKDREILSFIWNNTQEPIHQGPHDFFRYVHEYFTEAQFEAFLAGELFPPSLPFLTI